MSTLASCSVENCSPASSSSRSLELKLAVAVLPGAARLDEERLDADPPKPLSHVASNELGPVVRTNVLRCRVCNEQVGEAVEHVVGPELARHDDSQAAPLEFVDHREPAKAPPVLGAILHEVVRPRVIWAVPAVAGCRSVVEPQAAALGLFVRDFQPFPPPNAVAHLWNAVAHLWFCVCRCIRVQTASMLPLATERLIASKVRTFQLISSSDMG